MDPFKAISLLICMLFLMTSFGCLEEGDEEKNKDPFALLELESTVVNVGEEATFFGDKSTDKDGKIKYYYFWYGDGDSSGELDAGYAVHTYTKPGTYNVTLNVFDNKGGVGEDRKSIRVNDFPKPVITLQPNKDTIYVGDSLNLSGSQSEDSDGLIISYTWDFGDGGTANTMNVSHTFNSVGVYNVTLTTEDNDGASAVTSRLITVKLRWYRAIWNNTSEDSENVDSTIFNADEASGGNSEYQNWTTIQGNLLWVGVLVNWTDDDEPFDDIGGEPDNFITNISTPMNTTKTKSAVSFQHTINSSWKWEKPEYIFQAASYDDAMDEAQDYNYSHTDGTGTYKILIHLNARGAYGFPIIQDEQNTYSREVRWMWYSNTPTIVDITDQMEA